jgi:hypothetical protein
MVMGPDEMVDAALAGFDQGKIHNDSAAALIGRQMRQRGRT